MKISAVAGIIDHRILLNYRIDPDVVAGLLPAPLTPKLVDGWAIGGICQVSLSQMRPRGLPAAAGTRSHNAAHRIAVVHEGGEGVYVPRRDTDSRINQAMGGRLFPGVYERSRFEVSSGDEQYSVSVTNDAGECVLAIRASLASSIPDSSVFDSLEAVSEFFQAGGTGWSPSGAPGVLDTIELWTREWKMEPLAVAFHHSALFTDLALFPEGSVVLDCGLVMRGIEHEWRAHEGLACVCS